MLKIAICDDEARVLDEVSSHIKKYSEQRGMPELEVCVFNSARSLLSSIDNGDLFDIFLLDVYIGDEIGIALARDIRAKGIESPIMFLTTSIDHAPESFELGTLRYLIKPLDPLKLYEAIDAAIIEAERIGGKFIRLKTENGIESINVSSILYTESHSHYQYVKFSDGIQVRARMTVQELFDQLSQYGEFVRGGSAYIINLKKVKSVSTVEVCFYNNIKLSLPRGAHSAIKEAFWKLQYE